MNGAPAAIETAGLTKRFGGLIAVDGIDLIIREGEVFALLGPNGAGKTTFISMLCTLVKPSSGTARVAGHDIVSEGLAVRKNIGIVFQEPSVDDLLSGRENLQLHSMLYGVPRREIHGRIEKMLATVGLSARGDDRVRTYSGGMRRRLEIARGLIHEPRILFLDEPTLGLDPASRQAVWGYLRELRQRAGTTIILTTHYIEEAEEMADRIGIIRQGELMLVEEKTSLMKKLGKKELTLQLQTALHAIPASLDLPGLSLSPDHLELTYAFDANTQQLGIAGLLQRLSDLGIAFKDLHTTQSSLEDIFVGLINSESTHHEV